MTAPLARRRPLLGAAVVCAALPSLLRAQPEAAFAATDLEHARALREAALGERLAWRLVEELTTRIGARPAGSAADARAARWAEAQLRQAALANVRVEPMAVRVWQRGAAEAALTSPAARPLVMATLANSVATPPDGIEADVAYYPTLAALQAEAGDGARGRIVFIDERTERTRDGSGYGRAVRTRFNGAVEAARRGALAVVIRSIGTGRERVAHTGAMGYDLQVPRIPACAVSVPDADEIADFAAAGKALRLRLRIETHYGVEGTAHNVIAEVSGRGSLAHEIVQIGAHLDSWDLGQGALDDASGVAITSAAAALIQGAGRAPRRTIRLVLFGNEENGFDGARAYGDRYGREPHQLVSESDFGCGRAWRLASRVNAAALPLVAEIAQLLAPLGVAAEQPPRNDGSPGPDAAVLMRRFRWPALQLVQDGSLYFDVHHTVHDTLDKVDAAALAQNVACWAAVAWLAAQSPLAFAPAP